MKKSLVKDFKFNKETYKIYKEEPSYDGETGILGIELDTNYHVKTPPNEFGYEDIILFNYSNSYIYKNTYSLHRWQSQTLLKKCVKVVNKLLEKDYKN